MVSTGHQLVNELNTGGVMARLFGGAAIAFSCPGRAIPVKDLDLVVQAGGMKNAVRLLRGCGWDPDPRDVMLGDQRRVRFVHRELQQSLDVFMDPLLFNQSLSIGERLALHPVTLSPADLVLTKLQIHVFTERDADQLRELLNALPLMDGDLQPDGINWRRIVGVCSKNWPMHYACGLNLSRLRNAASIQGLEGIPSWLSATEFLQAQLAEAPKTISWKLRHAIGARMRWYYIVDR